jgi:hypothetical protein
MRDVTDRHHENQVEETLEPGGMAIRVEIFCIVHIV